jgi:hypothetical protein
MPNKPNKDTLSQYLAAFSPERPVLNRGLKPGGALRPISGQPGLFQVGLEALYGDALSSYDAPKLSVPETYLSGLEASPVVALDTGSELTVKAVQIFLNLSGYRGANAKPLVEDGTWGQNSAFALAAWQRANAGKEGVSSITVDQRRGKLWMPSSIAGDMRSKLALNSRGQRELGRSPAETQAPRRIDSRNAIPSSTDEASAGVGNVFETTPNLRAILRSLGVNVPSAGPADYALLTSWQKTAQTFGLSPAISADVGSYQAAVKADTLSSLRVKARKAGSGTVAPVTRSAQGGTAA